MNERRPLIDGLKAPPAAQTVDPLVEREFVHGAKPVSSVIAPAPSPRSRTPVSTRMRADLVDALKRISLERQLHKQQPNTLQEFLDEAVEMWLAANRHGD